MGIHLHLEDAKLMNVATFNDIGNEIGSVGVVLYEGDYYAYKRFEVQHGQFHVFYGVTNIMEVK